MLIRIQMVPEDHPLSISFVIPPAVMNAAEDGSRSPQLFDQPVKCDVKLRKIETDIFVQAKIMGGMTPDCDRCLGSFTHNIGREAQFTCQPITQAHMLDEEGDLYYFQGSELDLTPIIREIVLLNLPMKYICSESCQGLCGHCGASLDQEGACSTCQKVDIFPQKILQV